MGLFVKSGEPVILKESSSARAQIEELRKKRFSAPPAVRPRIELDIKLLEYGLMGEDRILFELKNSHMPMYVLHDIFLEYNGLTAQIDFIVITEKVNFVIECKNLFGNIEIKSNGDFVRTISYGTQYKKEGIYSPITQNKRHLELIKQIKGDAKSNAITKALMERYFYNFYQGIVVLANPKTVLNDKYAKKEIKNQVIRADQLIAHIQKAIKASKELSSSDKGMRLIAERMLELHREPTADYFAKHETENDAGAQEPNRAFAARTRANGPEEKAEGRLYQALRVWRYQQAQKENLKPYYIFYNTTLDELVEKEPKTMEQLKRISGLGDVKCQKYGKEILATIASCGGR